MKKLLLLTISLLALVGCSNDDDKPTEKIHPLYGTDKGGVYISTFYSNRLMSGEIVEEKYDGSLIQVWDAKGRDFDVEKSRSDIINGYLFDKKTQTSVKPIITSINKGSLFETLKEGKYFLYINTLKPDSYLYGKVPTFGYSYTYFDVVYKKDVNLKKVFDIQNGQQAPYGRYHPW